MLAGTVLIFLYLLYLVVSGLNCKSPTVANSEYVFTCRLLVFAHPGCAGIFSFAV